MKSWLPFGLMFLVCFGGVFAALRLNQQLENANGPASLDAFVKNPARQLPEGRWGDRFRGIGQQDSAGGSQRGRFPRVAVFFQCATRKPGLRSDHH